ncbi:MAG: hypothetical protein KC618_02440 [Candidatus Omnitrophica bacterium]|nr:hypothetical protein [Candidatus Omnitrophota bacterium]
MQKLMIKKNSDPKRKTKAITITQKTQDKESFTFVKKSFLYKVRKTSQISPKAEAPQIFIRKFFDTKRGVESFRLQVRGCFYINHNRMLLRVNFTHTLNIQILWKSKVFSPKKPVMLAD